MVLHGRPASVWGNDALWRRDGARPSCATNPSAGRRSPGADDVESAARGSPNVSALGLIPHTAPVSCLVRGPRGASGDAGNGARSFYTLLYTQGATLFPSGDPNKPDFNTPEAKKAFEFFETLAKNGYISKGLDGAAALGAFLNGDGAVMLTGTWRIDDFVAARAKADSPLKDGYTARIFPNLFKEDAVWADNHSWVLLRGGNDDKTRKAAMTFLKFMWDNNANWARGGGHLPVRASVVEEYAKLPERANVIRISEIGRALPKEVRRQFGFQSIIGEEINNVINGGKPAAKAAADAQERADQLLRTR